MDNQISMVEFTRIVANFHQIIEAIKVRTPDERMQERREIANIFKDHQPCQQ